MKEAIINLLRKWGCFHEWKLELEIKQTYENKVCGMKYLYICKKCGKMKWVET